MTVCKLSSCVAPDEAMHFQVPLEGGFIPEDTPMPLALQSNIITSTGLNAMYYYVEGSKYYSWAQCVSRVGYDVKTDKGTWSKRFGKLVWQTYGVKVPEKMLADLGKMAADHSKSSDEHVLVTRDFNRGAGYYANRGSCLWASEFGTRCMLKSNGGFALLTFPKDLKVPKEEYISQHYANGRIWVMPVRLRPGLVPGTYDKRSLIPTFNTLCPDGYVLFNGYGQLADFQGAKILAAMTGMSYVKVNLDINGMYINQPLGYAVLREDLAKDYATTGHEAPWISFSTQVHSHLFDFERAEWLEALGDDPATQNTIVEQAAEHMAALTPEQKERERRDRYNERRRAKRAELAAAALQAPVGDAVPHFEDHAAIEALNSLNPGVNGFVIDIDDERYDILADHIRRHGWDNAHA